MEFRTLTLTSRWAKAKYALSKPTSRPSFIIPSSKPSLSSAAFWAWRDFTEVSQMLVLPVLATPDFTHLFKLEVDASGSGADAVLLQEDEKNIDRPVQTFT